jgi:hypothetical protein
MLNGALDWYEMVLCEVNKLWRCACSGPKGHKRLCGNPRPFLPTGCALQTCLWDSNNGQGLFLAASVLVGIAMKFGQLALLIFHVELRG